MTQKFLLSLAIGSLISLSASAQVPQQLPQQMPKPAGDSSKPAASKKASVSEKTKGNKKFDGLFTIFQDTATGTTQLYIKKSQLGKKFVYQSFAENGPNSLGLGKGSFRDNA